jgi:hypothetical protein
MTEIIIKVLLIIIAAICKAAVVTHHPHTSRLWGDFWDLKIRRKFVPFTKYKLDGWHLCNSVMIISFIVAGVLNGYIWYYDIPSLGVVFILVFNLFYNKIFQYKKSVR